jgi:hypothetical protein
LNRRLHRLKLFLAITALAATMAFVPQATPAVAHDSWSNGWRWIHWPNPGETLCVGASGWQNHAEHWIGTHAMWGDCGTTKARPANALWNRGEWYWAGRFCFQVGWKSNQLDAHTLWTTRFLDLGQHGCDMRHHDWLTMDTWQVAAADNWQWLPNAEGWPGARPMTGHCHCP